MTTLLSDQAFYLVHLDGKILETTIMVPGENRRPPAFFVYSSVTRLREYARHPGTNLQGFNIMSFETLEDVERFVEQHRDSYEYVVINPELGRRSAIEPFDWIATSPIWSRPTRKKQPPCANSCSSTVNSSSGSRGRSAGPTYR